MPLVNAHGEMPLEEIVAAFRKHTAERPLIFKINPTYRSDATAEIEKVPAPQEKIFPGGELKRGDYSQGALGDCYLISALNALLAHEHGTKVLAGCIKDLTEYTSILGNHVANQVLVRVFYAYEKNPDQIEHAVGYLLFEKSVFRTDKRAIGFPIAQLFEQAFSYGFNLTRLSESLSYEVYKALFGEHDETVRVNTHVNQIDIAAFYQLAIPPYKGQAKIFLSLSRFHPDNPEPGITDYDLTNKFLNLKKNHLNVLMQQYWPKVTDDNSKQLADFMSFAVAARDLPEYKTNPASQFFIDSLIDHGLGLLKSSYVSETHKIMLKTVNDAFNAHHLVTLQTRNELEGTNGHAITSEPLALGMVGKHCYAVVGPVYGEKIGENDYHFVPIHNPWGRTSPYGVSYTRHGDQLLPAAIENSEFGLELKHFGKVVAECNVSNTIIDANTPNLLSRQALKAIADSEKSLNQFVQINYDTAFKPVQVEAEVTELELIKDPVAETESTSFRR
jgi:hypothetical protein